MSFKKVYLLILLIVISLSQFVFAEVIGGVPVQLGMGMMNGGYMISQDEAIENDLLLKFSNSFVKGDYKSANEYFSKLSNERKVVAIQSHASDDDFNLNKNILKINMNEKVKNQLIRASEILEKETSITNSDYARLLKDTRNQDVVSDFVKRKIKNRFAEGKFPLEVAIEYSSGKSPENVLHLAEREINKNPKEALSSVYNSFKSQSDKNNLNCYMLTNALQHVMFAEMDHNNSETDELSKQKIQDIVKADLENLERLDEIQEVLVPYLQVAQENGLNPDQECKVSGNSSESVSQIIDDLEKSKYFSPSLTQKIKKIVGMEVNASTPQVESEINNFCTGDMNQLLGLERSGICDISAAIKMIDENAQKTENEKQKMQNTQLNKKPKQMQKQDTDFGLGSGGQIKMKKSSTDCSVVSMVKVFRRAAVHGEIATRVTFTIRHQIKPNTNEWNVIVFSDIDLDELKKQLKYKEAK